jgi:putative FmdB family regulatory protein
MPLYEYQCESCHSRFERIQKFSDPPVDVCPTCGKGTVKKLLSSPAIQFKGSGWYITDYARKSGDTSKSGESKPTSSSDTSSSSSTTTGDTSSTSKSTDSTKKN